MCKVSQQPVVIIAPYHGELRFLCCVLGSTLHLAVLLSQSFMVGKPDSLGFTRKTATPQPSTKPGTLPDRLYADSLITLRTPLPASAEAPTAKNEACGAAL